jgi:hypothetical protein
VTFPLSNSPLPEEPRTVFSLLITSASLGVETQLF